MARYRNRSPGKKPDRKYGLGKNILETRIPKPGYRSPETGDRKYKLLVLLVGIKDIDCFIVAEVTRKYV